MTLYQVLMARGVELKRLDGGYLTKLITLQISESFCFL